MNFSLLRESLQPPDDDDDAKAIFGVVTGKVVDVDDPAGQGRVRVNLSFMDSEDASAWARVVTPMAGALHGTYFIPDVGDTVLVAFEHGDVDNPFVLGSLWNLKAMPPLPTPRAQERVIRTPAGNQMIFGETPPTITIQTAGPVPPVAGAAGGVANITLTPTGVQLTTGASTILVAPDGITLRSGASAIVINAQGIEIKSSSRVTVTAAADVTVSGALIKLN
jgi:phage baseplate assembly protein gpV